MINSKNAKVVKIGRNDIQKRRRDFDDVFNTMKYNFRKKKGLVIRSGVSDMTNDMRYIEVIGKKITFDSEDFLRFASKADNINMYPRTDDLVQIDWSFYGMEDTTCTRTDLCSVTKLVDPKTTKVRCRHTIEEIVNMASKDEFASYKVNKECYKYLIVCGDIIDTLIKDFDGAGFEVAVNDITGEISLGVIVPELAEISSRKHLFYNIVKVSNAVSFEEDDSDLVITFIMPTIWEK